MNYSDTGLYLEDGALGNFARNTAASIEVSGSFSLRDYSAALMRALRAINAAADRLTDDSGAARWLLDNRYIAEREAKEAARTLSLAGRLPAAAGDKRPAAAVCAGSLISSGRGEITEKRLKIFLTEYQKPLPLREKELWLFIPILKAELTFYLAAALPSMASEGAEELMRNVFASYRFLSSTDLSKLLEGVNRIEECLSRDPAGIYPRMDAETRAQYRRELARIARRAGMTELDAAKRAVELASASRDNHVGRYIFKRPLGKEGRKPDTGAFIAANVLITAFLTVLTGISLRSLTAAILVLIPISEIVKNSLSFLLTRLRGPRRLPRVDLEDGVPEAGRTVAVISALLASKEDGEKYAGLLEEYRLLNRGAGPELSFGILADLPEAKSEEAESDAEIIAAAKAAVDKLNRRYNGGFYLFIRGRELNSADGIYMGRERKRGAIRELVRLITGKSSTLKVACGDVGRLSGTGFILTLDADTHLTFDSAAELIGAGLHPLNTPVIDKKRGVVTEGCGIIAPSVAPELGAANRSDFARIFAGLGGIDPYGSSSSELYWDMFREATFTGKGLINVPAYAEVLDAAFPENTLLSHDIVEGAYLGCGYAGDVTVTDGFPYKVTSYFSRLDRWTRGDWQNLRYLMPYTKNEKGERRANPLSELSKWKIFDNLRRSLTPVFALASIMAYMLFGGWQLAVPAAIALLMNLSGLMVSSVAAFIKHDGSVTARFHSAVLHGVWGILAETGTRLILLPAEAWTLLRAIATAIFRMTVSHRGLLKWVTSSEAEKRHGNTVFVNYLRLAACPVAGGVAIAFGVGLISKLVGLLWVIAPLFAYALSREVGKNSGISGENRNFLLSCGADIWRWFTAFLTKEDNFLPPDNFQEEPNVGIAHRTSPTNIGLGLLSVITAADLGLTGEREAWDLVEKMLETMEKLPKWRGHLYNWYDTRTLEALEPAYVSSVDSGNLAAALIAAGQAAYDAGEKKTAARLYALLVDMDFSPLFDRAKSLFRIGIEIPSGEPSEGYYDLLSSEARLLSYVATALGYAPRKHWRRLGRSMVSLGGYRGMASWTGTMFEYLMPELLLPEYPASLLYETSRFALYCQRRANAGIPWGVSESSYYGFSQGLVYRYRAHGVAALSLNREIGNDRVVSPYSSFLALHIDPKRVVKNLKSLSRLGAVGAFGYYEAADFTGGDSCEIVRSYMAHHLGMSMVSIGNALTGGAMRRRFMKDPRMRAYSELLAERLPVGAITLQREKREVPEKPRRRENGGYSERISGADAIAPRTLPLSNGLYTALISETGKCRSQYLGLDITRWEPEPQGRDGLMLYLRTETDLMPLTPAPEYRSDVEYKAEFTSGAGKIYASCGDIRAETELTVPAGEAGEVRKIRINCKGKAQGELKLIAYFEPCLTPKRDFDAHPAFWKLCMEAKNRDGALMIRRRGRGALSEIWLALSSSVPGRYFTHMARGASPENWEFRGASPELCAGAVIPLKLENGAAEVTLAISAGESENAALESGRNMLEKPALSAITRLDATALMLGLEPEETGEALGLIPPLLYPTAREGSKTSCAQPDLWPFGISGDRPLIAAVINEPEEAEKLIRLHGLISENGVKSDLALLLTDSGDYLGRQRRAASALLARLGREGDGSVHLIEYSRKAEAVLELADLVYGQGAHEKAHSRRLPDTVREPVFSADGRLKYQLRADGIFEAAMRSKLPPVSWANILTNGSFGFIATESGTGHMWAGNAREAKLTPWLCDPITVAGGERLSLIHRGREVSLFADGGEWPTLLKYGFGWASWERDIEGVKTRVTAFVPENSLCRVLKIELSGAMEGDRLRYSARLSLGSGGLPPKNTKTQYESGVLRAFSEVSFILSATREPAAFTTSFKSLLMGDFDGALGFGEDACIAAEYEAGEGIVIVTGAGGIGEMRALCDFRTCDEALSAVRHSWEERVNALSFQTRDGALEAYAGAWAKYQVLASRLLGRTGLYQNGGAYGFRDQLQDAVNLVLTEPELTARVIKLAAAHQYAEGDVMHWWHPSEKGDKGVRTRCSDDLLWLTWALSEYALKTGDLAICRSIAPYLGSAPLGEGEEDRYETPAIAGEGTLLDHAKRAAELFLSRGAGPHGLPLMLAGDWNDGMNTVGGESVWLAFFGSVVLSKFSALLTRLGEREGARRCASAAESLREAGERAFEGDRFIRGYYGDGTPLGSGESGECAIDSVAQSFAVFAGADGKKTKIALDTAVNELFDRENSLVKLFTPPFRDGEARPGYIKSYAAGFRENGGQYTHAAVWLAIALIEAGEETTGLQLLEAMLPTKHDTGCYMAEPYVLAGDVYSNPDNPGRGGWSWYTGAAGWYHRAVTEYLLGLKIRDGRLYIEPRLPESLSPASVKLFDLDIEISGDNIRVNGEPYSPDGYKLKFNNNLISNLAHL